MGDSPKVDICYINLSMLSTVTIYATGILFVGQPILPKIIDVLLKNGSEPGGYPVPLDLYNIDEDKYYFYIILYSFLCACVALTAQVANDSMFIVSVQHGCGIFAALGHKLERLGKNHRTAEIGETAYASGKRDMDFEHLGLCIDRHNDAIEYAKLIEATYSWCMFFIVGFNMISISIVGLEIVKTTTNSDEAFKFLVLVMVGMGHLYMECFMSQSLMDHSLNISYYIHNGKWYTLSPRAQKLLPLMLMRCDVSSKLTAGKMTIMSVETFTGVLKTSMSYFTVLRSM